MRQILKKIKIIRWIYYKFVSKPDNIINPSGLIDFFQFYWYIYSNNLKINSKSNLVNNRALWIIPDFNKGSGGHLNIFRFIHFIEKTVGIESDVLILGANQWGNSSDVAKSKICEFFYSFSGNVFFYENQTDIITFNNQYKYAFATSWQTAYLLKNLGCANNKLYFIQDFEPYFFALGSEYSFAEQTYKFGFLGVTAGSWLSNLVNIKYGMRAINFKFAFERDVSDELTLHKSENGFPRVLFYARPPTLRRGFELGIFALNHLYNSLDGKVDICFVGWDIAGYNIPFKYQNLGILEYNSLNSLYSSCDVALVLSFTNMSLLPLEILSCGCEVVLNNGDNNIWLDNGELFHYVESDIVSISEKILGLIKGSVEPKFPKFDTHEIKEVQWENEARKVGNYLLGL